MQRERILHYRILGPLGRGGMGEVFLAEDERLGRRVALKFLPQAALEDPGARERLHREARSLAALSHPKIAAIHALEEGGDRAFLVMEYVEGETVATRIARRPLPIQEVAGIGLSIAEALAHAHSRGVVHRDVKPANVLVTPEGTAKLTDFGVALLEGATRLTGEGLSPGTVAYMSPEQARGEVADPRSDLFALGAVLYEALTGTRVFAGDRAETLLHAIQHRDPEPPTARRSGIPLELERIVLKCLKKDPALRYQHAEDLAADLRSLREALAAASEAPTATRLPTAGEGTGTRTPAGRRSLLRPLGIGVGLIGVVALLYLLGPLRPGSDSPPAAEAGEKSIAVLAFQHMEDPADSKREALMAASLLTVGLGQAQALPVVSAQRMADFLRQGAGSKTTVSGAEAIQAARKAGAAYVVTGFIYSTHPDVVLGAEVASVENGNVLTATRVSAPPGDRALFAAVDSLTASLTEGLSRAGFQTTAGRVDVAGLTTRDPASYRDYIRGLDYLYNGNMPQARQAFQSAIAADSTFALAWYYSAVASWWQHEFGASSAAVDRALGLGSRLAARERDGLRALSLLVRYDTAAAREQYRALNSRYPNDREFLYGWGEAAYHSYHYDEAARALQRAVEIDPTFAIAYVHLIDIAIWRQDADAARAWVQRLRAADPEGASSWAGAAFVHGLLGEHSEAIASLRETLRRDPGSWADLFDLGRLQAMTGDFDGARASFARLAEAGEPWWQDHAPLGNLIVLLSGGRLREAEALASREIRRLEGRIGMHLLGSYYLRSKARLAMGRIDPAISDLRSIAGTVQRMGVPSRAPGLSQVGAYLAKVGRVAEAEQVLREYQERVRGRPDEAERAAMDYLRGWIALAKGDARTAARFFRAGQPDGPPIINRWDARYSRARALRAAGERGEAFAVLDTVVRQGPYAGDFLDTFEAFLLRARDLEERGRNQEALALYRRVANQFRDADPGFRLREEARAGVRRLSAAS